MPARRGRWRPPIALVLVAPAALLYLVLFVAPFGNLTLYSLYDYSRLSGVIKTLSLRNYQRFWLDPFYLLILARTLRVSLVATLATLLAGYPIALYMSRATPRVRGWVTLLILSPLLVSVVVRSFGWLIILGPNGLIDSVLTPIGLAGVKLMHTEAAIVIGLVNVFLPYLVLSVVASLQAIDPAVPRAAASLGAGPWQVFWHVTLPLSLPGILAGCLIVFSLGASAFVTPALLGGAEHKVLSVLIYQQTMILQNWPFGAAIAFALLLIVLLLVTVQARLLERGRFRVVFH